MIQHDFSTARLRAETLRSDHAPLVWRDLQDQRLYKFSSSEPLDLPSLQARYDFLSGARSPNGSELWLNWVLFFLGSNKPIGVIQATILQDGSATIGYEIFPEYWRQGIGAESVREMNQILLREMGVSVIAAEMDVRNAGSVALARAAGMSRVALQTGSEVVKGELIDEYRYEIRS